MTHGARGDCRVAEPEAEPEEAEPEAPFSPIPIAGVRRGVCTSSKKVSELFSELYFTSLS